jgi:predicted CXXCH cytochrome family protein
MHFEATCARCHLAGDEVTPETARKLTMSQESLCGGCHQGAIEASHPTGIVPERTPPAAFPLDWKGEVTCSTCHEVHEGPFGGLRGTGESRELCLSCHDEAFFSAMPEAGESLMRSGHLDARARHPQQTFDAYSQRCIECHEAEASAPGSARVAFNGANGTGMPNHPIGSIYRPGRVGSDLRPQDTLPADVLLPDGKVSCLSCHQGYSRQHGEPVRSDLGLCRHCHNK